MLPYRSVTFATDMAVLHRQAIALADFARHRTAAVPPPISITPPHPVPPPHPPLLPHSVHAFFSAGSPSLSPASFTFACTNPLCVPPFFVTLSPAGRHPVLANVRSQCMEPQDRQPVPALISPAAMGATMPFLRAPAVVPTPWPVPPIMNPSYATIAPTPARYPTVLFHRIPQPHWQTSHRPSVLRPPGRPCQGVMPRWLLLMALSPMFVLLFDRSGTSSRVTAALPKIPPEPHLAP